MLSRGASLGLLSGGYVRRRLLVAVPLALLALLVMAAQAHAYLYFGQGNGSDCPIGRANLDGSGVNHDFIIQATCGSPAVDAKHIYFSYVRGRYADIARANIDGTGVDRSFIAPKGGADAIAVDDAHIYWSTATGIGRAKLDGSGVDPTFLKLSGGAQDLAVDSAHIYWSDPRGIGRANVDGTQPNPGFIAAGPNVDAIAVDSAHIYWANFGGLAITSPPGTIGRANLNGSGANPKFITGAHNPSGIGVEGSHIYWANYGLGTIGRANLDGSAANENFIRRADATGLAVDALTPSSGGSGSGGPMLRGLVTLNALGGKTHGYTKGVGASFGTAAGAGADLSLVKTRLARPLLTETDSWAIRLQPGEFALNRSKVWIEVIAPLGHYGQIDFTFTGKPRRRSLPCGQTQTVAQGTLQGKILIRTGERFFKTVTVRRMNATVMDTPTPATAVCPQVCAQPDYAVSADGPFRTGAASLGLYSEALGAGRFSSESFLVKDPTIGTPFSLIEHQIGIVRRRPFFTANPSLRGVTLTTPGGLITGALSVRGSTPLTNVSSTCKGHRYRSFGRGARVSGGKIMVRFNSIGAQVFGPHLTAANMSGYRRVR